MDPSVVAVDPEALEQFREVFADISGPYGPLTNAEQTLRRILRHAVEDTENKDAFAGKDLSVRRTNRYLFGFDADSTLVAVRDLKAVARRRREKEKERQILGLRDGFIPPPAPPIDVSKVYFSTHAIEQFRARFPAHGADDPEKAARELLAMASEKNSISKVGIVRRLIDNHYVEVRYFRLGRCRFVVRENSDGTFTALTVEYAYLE